MGALLGEVSAEQMEHDLRALNNPAVDAVIKFINNAPKKKSSRKLWSLRYYLWCKLVRDSKERERSEA